MRPSEFLETIVSRASQFVQDSTRAESLGEVWLCHDDNAQRTLVKRSDLIEPAQASEFLLSVLNGGPSWVHVKVIKNPDFSLLTVRTGDKVGNPNPAINLSLERRKIVFVE